MDGFTDVFEWETMSVVFHDHPRTQSSGRTSRLLPQGQSQTYPEEERPCLSKYWKIYFPYREISLELFLDYLFHL